MRVVDEVLHPDDAQEHAILGKALIYKFNVTADADAPSDVLPVTLRPYSVELACEGIFLLLVLP